MRSILVTCLLVPFVAMPTLAQVADPIRAKLNDAKQKYEDDSAKLRESILKALERRETQARAEGDKKTVDVVLAQRKAFESDGVHPASIPATTAKAETVRMNRVLIAAFNEAVREYVRAKKDAEADMVEQEKFAFMNSSGEGTADPNVSHSKPFTETQWEWDAASTLKLAAKGVVSQSDWTKSGLTTTWTAVDRRTVVLQIVKGRDHSRIAVLTFNEDMTSYVGYDFSGEKIGVKKRLR